MDVRPIMRLEQLCQVTSSKRIYATELVSSGVPFLKSKEIIEKVNGQDHSDLLFISEERFQKIAEQTGSLVEGDVLLTSRGTLGIPYVVRRADRFHFADGNLTWFRKFEELESRYLSYFFMSPTGKAELAKCIIGSSQQAYTIAALKRIEIALPPLPTQRRIASILSTYDDLIENNTKRIKILEDMARVLYREWFVHFRFPGHEKVRMIDSPLGKIPEGWEVVTLADLADVNRASIKTGKAPKEIHYVDIQSVSTGSIDKVERMNFNDAPGRARRIVADGDTIWSTVRPNRKSFALLHDPHDHQIVSTGFAVLSPRRCPSAFLYMAVTTEEFVAYLVNRARGSAYPAVTGKDFEAAEMLLPGQQILQNFSELAEPMLRLASKMKSKNDNLRKTRDLLLPKLISGEIDVDGVGE